MNEFLKALAITLAFVFFGYFLFGSFGSTQRETGTMDMRMEGMEMTTENMESMPGMTH